MMTRREAINGKYDIGAIRSRNAKNWKKKQKELLPDTLMNMPIQLGLTTKLVFTISKY